MSLIYSSRVLRALGGALAVGLSLGAAYAVAAPSAPEGIWYTDGKDSIIKVHPCAKDEGTYCGMIVWLKEPNEADGKPKVDALNKDPAKRNKPMVGLEILKNMAADEDHWTGKAYNPEDGKLYDITFKVKSANAENDAADLRGCILGFLCKTETFTRAAEVPGGEPVIADAGHKKRKSPKKDAASQ